MTFPYQHPIASKTEKQKNVDWTKLLPQFRGHEFQTKIIEFCFMLVPVHFHAHFYFIQYEQSLNQHFLQLILFQLRINTNFSFHQSSSFVHFYLFCPLVILSGHNPEKDKTSHVAYKFKTPSPLPSENKIDSNSFPDVQSDAMVWFPNPV